MSGPCCVWDFTLGAEFSTKEKLIEWLQSLCKKWCFQLELAASGYKHFQGRLSLGLKRREGWWVKLCPWKETHFSVTSTENRDNNFYACKSESRIEGPWMDTDPEPVYVPKQVRDIVEWRPWQLQVLASCQMYDSRTINILVDNKGNVGKTVLCTALDVWNFAYLIPPLNDAKELMQWALMGKGAKAYLFDMPRAMKKDKLCQMYTAIECIKSGLAYDSRYKCRKVWFDCPIVWVFTNKWPKHKWLSGDRWRFWTIDGGYNLIKTEPALEFFEKKQKGVLRREALPPCNTKQNL